VKLDDASKSHSDRIWVDRGRSSSALVHLDSAQMLADSLRCSRGQGYCCAQATGASGEAMSDFLWGAWSLLVYIYNLTVSNGVPGCVFVMIAGIVMSKIGVSITGQEESFSGTANYGNVVLHKNPAIKGSAKSWL